jgi:hypothetical protein
VPPAEAGAWSTAWERITENRLAASSRDSVSPGPDQDDVSLNRALEEFTAEPAGWLQSRAATVRRLLAGVAGPRRALLLGAGVLLAAGIWVVLPDGNENQFSYDEFRGRDASPTRSFALVSAGSIARIRPARTPHLCLMEGREHTGQYRTAIAVQRPCDQAQQPSTIIEPVGDGLHHIKWDHPEEGLGCLTVLSSGPAKDMLEPRNNCSPGERSQLFRIEPVDTPVPGAYRLRPAHTNFCLGIRDDQTASDAEAVQQPCTNDSDQAFMIDLIPPT